MAEIEPIRIQRKRTKDFNLQEESRKRNGLPCVYVGRPTRFGNRFMVYPKTFWTPEMCVIFFESDLELTLEENPHFLDELKGKNLACWCSENTEHCHANVLLKMANK